MSHKPMSKRTCPKAVLRLPDLDLAKSAVLNSSTSADAQRGYRHAINSWNGIARSPGSRSVERLSCVIGFTSNLAASLQGQSIFAGAPSAAWRTRPPILGSLVLIWLPAFDE